jgi:hypothetical protein
MTRIFKFLNPKKLEMFFFFVISIDTSLLSLSLSLSLSFFSLSLLRSCSDFSTHLYRSNHGQSMLSSLKTVREKAIHFQFLFGVRFRGPAIEPNEC